jgi:uncharacterized membrane protein YhaH (DUF805 family)
MNGNPNMVFCSGCGRSLHMTAVTCPQCGAPQGPIGLPGQGDGIPRTFARSISLCLSKYANFQGRAPRPEYWWFILFVALVNACFSALAAGLASDGVRLVGGLVALAFSVPSMAVGVRRLHDVDRSGWWLLIGLVPLIGFVLLVWACSRGTRGDNRFGPENGMLV